MENIAMPKMNHLFKIKFAYSSDNFNENDANTFEIEEEHPLSVVSKDIVEFNIPRRNYANFGMDFENFLDFQFYDTVGNRSIKVLDKFGKEQQPFDIIVEILDMNQKVVEQNEFIGCTVNNIKSLRQLSYNQESKESIVSFKPIDIVGNECNTSFYNILKTIQTFLKLTISKKPKLIDSPCIIKRVKIHYNKRVDFFY